MVIDIEEYLLKVCSPLQDQMALNNILTGEVVTNVNLEKLIGRIKEGNIAYTKFITDRLKKRHCRYTQPLVKSSLCHQRSS